MAQVGLEVMCQELHIPREVDLVEGEALHHFLLECAAPANQHLVVLRVWVLVGGAIPKQGQGVPVPAQGLHGWLDGKIRSAPQQHAAQHVALLPTLAGFGQLAESLLCEGQAAVLDVENGSR